MAEEQSAAPTEAQPEAAAAAEATAEIAAPSTEAAPQQEPAPDPATGDAVTASNAGEDVAGDATENTGNGGGGCEQEGASTSATEEGEAKQEAHIEKQQSQPSEAPHTEETTTDATQPPTTETPATEARTESVPPLAVEEVQRPASAAAENSHSEEPKHEVTSFSARRDNDYGLRGSRLPVKRMTHEEVLESVQRMEEMVEKSKAKMAALKKELRVKPKLQVNKRKPKDSDEGKEAHVRLFEDSVNRVEKHNAAVYEILAKKPLAIQMEKDTLQQSIDRLFRGEK